MGVGSWKMEERKLQASGNIKHQTSNFKKASNFKLRGLAVWSLKFEAFLKFDVWCLELLLPTISLLPRRPHRRRAPPHSHTPLPAGRPPSLPSRPEGPGSGARARV